METIKKVTAWIAILNIIPIIALFVEFNKEFQPDYLIAYLTGIVFDIFALMAIGLFGLIEWCWENL